MPISNQDQKHEKTPLLEVNNLSLHFHTITSGLRETKQHVIRGLDLTIAEGEIVAVFGASGSGKSLLANAIIGILPENAAISGEIKYKGEILDQQRKTELRGNEISLMPQSINALDPLMKTGKQVRVGVKERAKKSVQREVFRRVGLATEVENQYPFQLSGGTARRVLVAATMVSDAKLLIADEPTPGLDEEVLKETMDLIRKVADEGKGVMIITHDIDTVLAIADKVAIMYSGETVEVANVNDFAGKGEALRHPYTKALWNALPQNDFTPLPGWVTDTKQSSQGCIFQPRCPWATPICMDEQPLSKEVNGGTVRCFHA
ncbi:ABC transporter ATP-binding protein [Desertibacillus haloalkaliphilus]|uniref:ABC transporter ATP-binding protein n=1 Tax=Desertibacillus haloalkaliphilus TaxID=1328930 RepID=UPI001C256332|nr:ABC transporter ATP-binding protein [Desertibacillus haloalkaliphilus]MBU8906355.1 ABC transporter ATP-binding protein [Desertibacillus haloalkaliphilus]